MNFEYLTDLDVIRENAREVGDRGHPTAGGTRSAGTPSNQHIGSDADRSPGFSSFLGSSKQKISFFSNIL